MVYRSKFFALRLSRCWCSLTESKFVKDGAPELEGDKFTAETGFGLHKIRNSRPQAHSRSHPHHPAMFYQRKDLDGAGKRRGGKKPQQKRTLTLACCKSQAGPEHLNDELITVTCLEWVASVQQAGWIIIIAFYRSFFFPLRANWSTASFQSPTADVNQSFLKQRLFNETIFFPFFHFRVRDHVYQMINEAVFQQFPNISSFP